MRNGKENFLFHTDEVGDEIQERIPKDLQSISIPLLY